MRLPVAVCTFVVCLIPAAALAQAVVTGHARDGAGAGLADVTVEVRSEALIGRARTVQSDAAGRYRLAGLPPGLYDITFARQGFRTLRVEGVAVSLARAAVVDGDLVAGSNDVVTSLHDGSPIEARSAIRRTAIDGATVRDIPNRRNYNSWLVTVPGVETESNDVVLDPLPTAFPFHGGRVEEGRLLVDGLSVGSAPLGGSPAHYLAGVGHAEEIVFTTTGALGEAETGGLQMNLVPAQGGNSLRGSVSFAGNSSSMRGDNLSQDLQALGLRRAATINGDWDLDAAAGGPVARDRLWFFLSGRRQQLERPIPGLYPNLNAGNPSAYGYSPDLGRTVVSDRVWENANARLTGLLSTRHRLSVFVDEQAVCRACTGATSATGFPDATISPEAQGVGDIKPQRVHQASWTSTVTSRFLADARYSRSQYGWGNGERDGNNRSLVRVAGSSGFFNPTLVTTWRSQDWADNDTSSSTWHATGSFWAGAHTLKAGYQGLLAADDRSAHTNDHDLLLRLSSGIGNSLMQVIAPFDTHARVKQSSAFVQDEWTAGRLTLQGAVRFDQVRSWFPEQRVAAQRFLPAGLVFPETAGVDRYRDFTPRAGAAYDVFGTGGTVVKVSVGKYLAGASTSGIYTEANPANRLVRTTNRSWFDSNVNYVVDCVLENPLGNGECGALNTPLFGQQTATSVDPSLLTGSGVRPSDWSVAASVAHRIAPRASVEVSYHRRQFDGFTVVDNVLVSDADFIVATVTAPRSENLPGGGGQTIGPLYLQNPASFARFQSVTMPTDRYGDQTRRSDAVDLLFDGRLPFGLWLQGGSSTVFTTSDSCAVRAAVRESAPLNPYCHVSSGARTQVRAVATYVVPTLDVRIGAVYQNKPGVPLVANYTSFATPFISSPFVTVNLIEPGTLYGERISQLDLRVTKGLRFGRFRAVAGIDLYNAFNSSDALSYGQSYTFSSFSKTGLPVYPLSVMSPRVLRISADVRF